MWWFACVHCNFWDNLMSTVLNELSSNELWKPFLMETTLIGCSPANAHRTCMCVCVYVRERQLLTAQHVDRWCTYSSVFATINAKKINEKPIWIISELLMYFMDFFCMSLLSHRANYPASSLTSFFGTISESAYFFMCRVSSVPSVWWVCVRFLHN